MGIDEPGQLEKGEVLEEFELDGKPAKVIRLTPADIGDEELAIHAKNLADTNFKPLDVRNADRRVEVREQLHGIRQKVKNVPIVGKRVTNSEFLDSAMNRIYPDISHAEHFTAYKEQSFPRYLGRGTLLGVVVDDKVVAVQAYGTMGISKSGRKVYEFTKASTMDKYKGKKLNPKMKKLIYDQIMADDPDGLWVGASVNPDHLKKFEERGWHVVEVDDPHEAVQVMNATAPEYMKTMKKQGYKAVYLDPKVDQVSSGVDSKSEELNLVETLTHDGQSISVLVKGDSLFVDSHELPLSFIRGCIQPGTRISDDAPTLEEVERDYDEMGWELKLGDLTLKGYKGKEGVFRGEWQILIILDSSGTIRGDIDASLLLAIAQRHGV